LAANPARVQEPTNPAPAETRSTQPRATRVEIVAITADDALLEQLGAALDGESLIRHADSPEEARGLVTSSQPSVVLLDARGFDDPARVVGELQSTDTARIVVIFTPEESSDEVARALRGSAAFAVLTIPVVQAQAAAVLEGACEEARARHALQQQQRPAPAPASPQPAEDRSAAAVEEALALEALAAPSSSKSARTQARGGGTRKLSPALGAGAVALLLVAAAIGYWVLRTPAPDAGEVVESPAVADVQPAAAPEPAFELEALQAGSVDELLDSARAAMRERRYTDPENHNAYTYYRSVLAQDPRNGEAREGLERIAAVLQERLQASLDAQRFDEAGRTLAQLRAIRPDDPAIARFEATLNEGRARVQAEIDRRQVAERAAQLADLVSLRIRQGRLVDPANDSAKYYLAQLRRTPGDPQRLNAATDELQQAYLERLRDALAKSQRAEAERWKTEARALGVSAADLNALQRDVTTRAAVAESKQQAAQLAQLVQERIAGGRLLEPARDSAVFHLNALRALDPVAAAPSERAVSGALLEQGRFALAEQRLDVARTYLAAARQLGVNADAVAALERDIGNAGASPRTVAAPPAPPKLVRTRYVPPDYPAAAMKQGLAGSVRLRFTVNAEGQVSEAAVVEATPPGVFDAAAVSAARKWRFKPIGEKGSGVTAIATVDVTFKPEDRK
jgi:TonB family protein